MDVTRQTIIRGPLSLSECVIKGGGKPLSIVPNTEETWEK